MLPSMSQDRYNETLAAAVGSYSDLFYDCGTADIDAREELSMFQRIYRGVARDARFTADRRCE